MTASNTEGSRPTITATMKPHVLKINQTASDVSKKPNSFDAFVLFFFVCLSTASKLSLWKSNDAT